MYRLRRSTANRQRHAAIIRVHDIWQACHLGPRFGSGSVGPSLTTDNVLEVSNEFYFNYYINMYHFDNRNCQIFFVYVCVRTQVRSRSTAHMAPSVASIGVVYHVGNVALCQTYLGYMAMCVCYMCYRKQYLCDAQLQDATQPPGVNNLLAGTTDQTLFADGWLPEKQKRRLWVFKSRIQWITGRDLPSLIVMALSQKREQLFTKDLGQTLHSTVNSQDSQVIFLTSNFNFYMVKIQFLFMLWQLIQELLPKRVGVSHCDTQPQVCTPCGLISPSTRVLAPCSQAHHHCHCCPSSRCCYGQGVVVPLLLSLSLLVVGWFSCCCHCHHSWGWCLL